MTRCDLYYELADEFIKLRSSMPQMQVEREISKSFRGEMFVLNYLFEHNNAAYPKNLSKGMMVSTARIAVILNHLERSRLIVRTADCLDNRQIIVSLTEQGLQLCRRQRDIIKAHIANLLEQLGPDDAREYIRLQKKILQISIQR